MSIKNHYKEKQCMSDGGGGGLVAACGMLDVKGKLCLPYIHTGY